MVTELSNRIGVDLDALSEERDMSQPIDAEQSKKAPIAATELQL